MLESIKCHNVKVIQIGKNEDMKLLVLMIFALTIVITPAFAELDLSNQKIVSLDGKILLEFGENIQTFKRGEIIDTPQLEYGVLKLADKTVFLEGEYTNILGNSFSVRLDDGKIYAKNNQDGTFTVKVLTLTDNGFQKQTFSSVLQPIEIIESPEIIQPTEKTDTLSTEPEEEQYIPDLLMTSSHDFRTYWRDIFNIDVQAFDGRINSNPQASSFEGRIDGVDVKVLLSLDNVPFATLSGVTANNGHWGGEYFFQDNSFPGEYVVDVIASYLGETVSKSSSMFIIGTVGGSDSSACNVFATGTVTLVSVTGATHSSGTITAASDITDGDTVTVGADTFTAESTLPVDAGEFDVTGNAAADLAALLALIQSTSAVVQAETTSATVITVTAISLTAAIGDAIVLTETGDSIDVNGAGTLGGGVDVTDEVTLNGLQYSPVTNPLPTTPVVGEFDVSDASDDVDATALNTAINLDTRQGTSGDLSSTVTTNTVTITTNICGTAGNAITMSETGTTITISGATLSGGAD